MIITPGPPYVRGSIFWDGLYPPAPQPKPVAFCADELFVLFAPPTPAPTQPAVPLGDPPPPPQNVFPV